MSKPNPYLIVLFVAAWIGLLAAACGGHYDIELHGQATLKVDVSDVTKFMVAECEADLGASATDAQVSLCVAQKLDKFASVVGGINI